MGVYMSSKLEYSFEFNQTKDLFKKIKSLMYDIAFNSVTNRDGVIANKLSSALCQALAIEYLVAQRKYGAEGGKDFFSWFKKVITQYDGNANIVNRDIDNILLKLDMQHNRQMICTVLERLQKVHNTQNIKINIGNINNNVAKLINFLKANNKNRKSEVNVYSFIQDINQNIIGGRISHYDLIDTLEKHLGSDDDGVKKIFNSTKELKLRNNIINQEENLDVRNITYSFGDIVNNLCKFSSERNLDNKNSNIVSDPNSVDSATFIDMFKLSIDMENTKAKRYLSRSIQENGLIYLSNETIDNRRKYIDEGLTSKDVKLNKLIDDLNNLKRNMFFNINTKNHAMAISYIINVNGSKRFTFFDPNFGEISYDNISDFKNGVKKLLNQKVNIGRGKKILGEVYGISQGSLKELDVNITINEFENDVIRNKKPGIFKQAQDSEQSYIVKSLKENNIIFDLSSKSTAKVIDYSLIQKETGEWLVKSLIVEVTAEGKTFNVHQSVDSFDIAVKNLKSNINVLIKYKNNNPSIIDLDLTEWGIKKSTVSFVPDVVKEKTHSEIAVYTPELESLSSRTKRVIDILDSLAEKRVSLAELSSNSKNSLAEFFNLSHDVLNDRAILRVIADSDFYLQTRLELSELQQVSANNAQLEKLTAREALVISKQNHADKAGRYLKSINLTGQLKTKPASMVNQILTLSTDSASALKKQLDLGAAYLYASSKGDLPQFKQQIAKHLELCYLKAQGIISDNERKQLDNFNEKFNSLSELQYKDIRHHLTDKDLSSIPALDIGYYQLMADDNLLNISVEKIGDNYSYSIYDTEGGESNFCGINKIEVSKKALSFIEGYVTANTKTQAAQNHKLYSWDFSDGVIDSSGLRLKSLYQQNLITERQRLVELGNTFFDQQKIAFSTLFDMGAVLDGKLITADAVANNPDWQTKILFDPFLINEFYTLPDQTSLKQQQSVKVIKTLLKNKSNNGKLLNYHTDPKVIYDTKQYISAIDTSVDLDGNTNPKLWNRLTQVTAQSNRFQSFGQKVGTGAQAIGVLTLSISTYGMAKRLQDPNITDEDRAEITKQLAISWSSVSVDFGTDLMQPTFDKAYNFFSKKLLSGTYSGTGRLGYKMAAKTTKYAGAGLNLASAGFDIHEAIEHFSKALSERNPDLKIDSIVNGSLATIGAAVSIATAIALAIGTSTAGPIGIIAGFGIMLGGMIYNAVRQVEYIKREIELTGWQEFKTGIRLAFGAEPEQEILDKLSAEQKRKMHEFRVELVNNTYSKIIQPMGFNALLYVNEDVDLTPVKKYIFIYKSDSVYSHSSEEWLRQYTHDSSEGYLSDKEIERSILTDLSRADMKRYYLMRYKTKPLSANDYDKWRETVNVDDFYIIEKNESDIDNRYSQNNLIIKNNELFQNHPYLSGLSNSWLIENQTTATIEISKNMDGNINTYFNFYEYNTTESTRANWYGDNPDKSTHFNPGRGNDLIVGYKDHRNSFDVGEGEKIFIGGDKEDTFYLMGDVRASSHSRTTVLDGQGGSDTLILQGLRFGKGYTVDLERGMVKYIGDELSVASVSNIENVYGHDGFYNEIKGDVNDNFLKVGNGEAYLEGRAGNDILALNTGTAIGGGGMDTYVISSNETTPIDVTIIDEGLDELSSIMLPVNVESILSISLSGNDVVISVDEKKHSKGQILLKDIYKFNDYGDGKILAHKYIINTNDGFVLLSNWPTELTSSTVITPSLLEMTAHYNYLTDRTLYNEGKVPDKPHYLISHCEQTDNDYMRIDDRLVIFPTFIKCSSEANGIIPHQIFGTQGNDVSSNYSSQFDNHNIEGGNLGLLIDSMARDSDTLNNRTRDPVGQIYGADFSRTWSAIAVG